MGRVDEAAAPGWTALLCATAAVGVANSVVFSLLSDLQDSYGFGDSGLGFIAGAGMAVGFVSQLLLAPLADRGHSKRLLLAGLAAAIVGSVMFAASSTLVALVVARAIVGLSNGLFLPAARAIAASMSPDRVGERLGTLGGVELAGFVTGPVIGAVLVGPFGIRWPFLVCGLFAFIALVALARQHLPSPPLASHPGRLSLDLLRVRNMQIGVLLTMALFFPVGMYDAILDRYMTDRGASNLLIGIGFLMYGVPFALLATRGGRLADRHGAFRMSMVSLVLVVPLTAVYGILTAPLLIASLFAVEGSVQALGVPATQAFVADAAPHGRASAAQGLSGAMNLLGATVSAVAAPAIYGAWGAGAVFGAAAALVALAGGAAAALRRTAAPLPDTVGSTSP
jgi:predicted MFS family arabinose efflux permease